MDESYGMICGPRFRTTDPSLHLADLTMAPPWISFNHYSLVFFIIIIKNWIVPETFNIIFLFWHAEKNQECCQVLFPPFVQP